MSISQLLRTNDYDLFCDDLQVDGNLVFPNPGSSVSASIVETDSIESYTLGNTNIEMRPAGTGQVAFKNAAGAFERHDVSALTVNRTVIYPDKNLIFDYGSYVPLVLIDGGSAWVAAGISATGTFIRLGSLCMVTAQVSIPGGTSSTSLNLQAKISLPFTTNSSVGNGLAIGRDNDNFAPTDPANGAGDISILASPTDQAVLAIVDYRGLARLGNSPDQHEIGASFIYTIA